jgi:hypothetical protein
VDIWEGDLASWRSRVAALTGLRGARINPGWERVRALSIAAVIAALISGLVGWRCRPQQAAPQTPTLGRHVSVVSSRHPAAGLGDAWRHAPFHVVKV